MNERYYKDRSPQDLYNYHLKNAVSSIKSNGVSRVMTPLDNLLDNCQSDQARAALLDKHSYEGNDLTDRLMEYKAKADAHRQFISRTGHFEQKSNLNTDWDKLRSNGLTERENKKYKEAVNNGNFEQAKQYKEKIDKSHGEKIELNEILAKPNKWQTDHSSEKKKKGFLGLW